jgi:hypothetical protein
MCVWVCVCHITHVYTYIHTNAYIHTHTHIHTYTGARLLFGELAGEEGDDAPLDPAEVAANADFYDEL